MLHPVSMTLCFMNNLMDKVIFFVSYRPWQHKSLIKGFENSMTNGPLLGYPVLGAFFEIHGVTVKKNTSENIIAAATVEAIKTVLKQGNL